MDAVVMKKPHFFVVGLTTASKINVQQLQQGDGGSLEEKVWTGRTPPNHTEARAGRRPPQPPK